MPVLISKLAPCHGQVTVVPSSDLPVARSQENMEFVAVYASLVCSATVWCVLRLPKGDWSYPGFVHSNGLGSLAVG